MPSAPGKPFLKWAGGKTRLLDALSELIPETIETYYEPFVGGGSLFFHLARQGRFRRAVINDSNPEIAACYTVIRDSVEALIDHLRSLEVSRATFETLRGEDPATLDLVARAGRTIFLNKTCFNGLYRLNRRGEFNVPWGDYTNPRVVDEPNLRACSTLLASVTVLQGDFVEAVRDAGEGDVVYFDPPYVPLTPTSSFKNYTKEGFSLDDQRRLATLFRELHARGAFVLESNSDTPTVHELYEGFELRMVRMLRNINVKSDSRGAVNELLVMSPREDFSGRQDWEAT